MWISIIIGAIIVILGIYALVTSIKKEVNDGCYACSSKDSCSKKSCPSEDLIAKGLLDENKKK